MQSLLSGDFEDLLCESLDASSVKERGQVNGVEGEGRGRGRQCRNGGDSTLIEMIGISWLQVISPNAWCCPHVTKCRMYQLYTSPHPTHPLYSPPPIPVLYTAGYSGQYCPL